MKLNVAILAAGQGRRMCSNKPKVLHAIAGKPMLARVIQTASKLDPAGIFVIYGHQGEQIRTALADLSINWIEQVQQLGTGHAMLQVLPQLALDSRTLILLGDTPLLRSTTLRQLLEKTPEAGVGLVTANMTNPEGLGRIIRDQNTSVQAIIEEKDATSAQKKIHEINTGIMLVPTQLLHEWLPMLKSNNAQQEYYLTDIIALAVKQNIAITTVAAACEKEVQGINNRSQLTMLERHAQKELAEALLNGGVTIIDPARFDVRGEVQVGQDTVIDINAVFEGQVTIGQNCHIEPNVILRDVVLADNVTIKANSIIEGASIASGCEVGPFARVRPGTELAMGAKIGNFVEIKKTQVGQSSKINHLSYIGDALVESNVNIGAGTITCNYDGANKHQTIIKENAFIGSGTELVAPVTVANNATIGAGSTITQDVPEGQLTLCRAKDQISIADWQRPEKKGNK